MIERLRKLFPEEEGLEWNFDKDNFEALYRSDLLISDYSSVVFDYALIFDRPVIYADVSLDPEPYDAGWLDGEMWILRTLPRIGTRLTEENIGKLPELIEESLHSQAFAEGRRRAAEEAWVHPGESVRLIADYLTEVRRRLTEKDEKNDEK